MSPVQLFWRYFFTIIIVDALIHADTSFRTNFCEIHKKVERNEIPLRDALSGMNISISVISEIDKRNPHLAVRVLNEVSRRAHFEYTPYVSGTIMPNESWTDLLIRSINSCDLAVDRWQRTSTRMAQGVIFPEAWYDSDAILIARQEPAEDTFIIWAFSKPFSTGLWFLTLSTIIFTGIMYYIFDVMHSKTLGGKAVPNIDSCIFTSFDSFTGTGSSFAPSSNANRILTISMAFLYLILVSAYTANLANYYIFKSRPIANVKSIDDAISRDLVVCVPKGYPLTERLKTQYPKVNTLDVEDEKAVFVAVSKGCAAGVVTVGSYDLFKRDKEVNMHCDISWVGDDRVSESVATFAIGDSEVYCSSLLDQVLDYHLMRMKLEGKLNEITQRYIESVSAPTCLTTMNKEETATGSLHILNMGGIFAFHGCLVIIAIIVGIYDYLRESKDTRRHINNELKLSLQSSRMLTSISSRFSKRNLNIERSKESLHQIGEQNGNEHFMLDLKLFLAYQNLKVHQLLDEQKIELEEAIDNKTKIQTSSIKEVREISKLLQGD